MNGATMTSLAESGSLVEESPFVYLSSRILRRRFNRIEKTIGPGIVWFSRWDRLYYSVESRDSTVLEYEGEVFVAKARDEEGYIIGLLPIDGSAHGMVYSRLPVSRGVAMRVAKMTVCLGEIECALDKDGCCVFDLLTDAIEAEGLGMHAKSPRIQELAMRLDLSGRDVISVLEGLRQQPLVATEAEYDGMMSRVMWPVVFGAD